MISSSLKNALAFAVSFSVFAVAQTARAADCSPLLKNLETKHHQYGSLCSLAERYQTALQTLRNEGVAQPERMANLMAARLIDLPDWIKKDASYNYNPVNFYLPAPTTWVTWEKGVAFVNKQVAENEAKHTIEPFTLDWFQKLHIATMTGVMNHGLAPGVFRQSQELGKSILERYAVTPAQAKEMSNGSGYKSLIDPNRPLLTWQPKVCYEQLDLPTKKILHANMQAIHWPDAAPDAFITMPDGQKKQCGYAFYTDVKEAMPQLEAWLTYVNSTLAELTSTHSLKQDPAEFLARIQRWFIVIHPFSDGNGRMSRFALEVVAESMGLPAPILAEMNDDITTPEAQWADQIVQGMARSVHVAEACAAQPKRVGCNVLPKVVQ